MQPYSHDERARTRGRGRPGLLDSLLEQHPGETLDSILLDLDTYDRVAKALRQARARGMEPQNPASIRAHMAALNPRSAMYTLTDEDRAAIRAVLGESLTDLRTAALLDLRLNITPALRVKVSSPSAALTASEAVRVWLDAAGVSDGFLLRAIDETGRVLPYRATPEDLRAVVVLSAARAGIHLDHKGRRWRLAVHDG